MLVVAERSQPREPAPRQWRGIGRSFWSDPLGEIERGIRHGLSDFESDARAGLKDLESDVRHGLSDFESKNREGIQLAFAGASCAVGTAYLGPAGAPLVCAPMNALLNKPGSPGVLVDLDNPADPYHAEAEAYVAANPWLSPTGAPTSKGLGLFAAIALAVWLAMRGGR